MKKFLFILLGLVIVSETLGQVVKTHIGSTLYDLQTNNSIQRRVAVHPSTKDVIVTFTGGYLKDASFSDRGTGYAYYSDATATWSNFMGNNFTLSKDTFFGRIEGERVGWPNPMFVGNKELILTHRAPATGGGVGTGENGIYMVSRNTAGSGTWTKGMMPGNTNAETWPRAEASGSNIIVINAQSGVDYNGLTNGLSFRVSIDGGNTWSQTDSIPGINRDNYASMSGDNYAVDIKNNTAAILTGSLDVSYYKTTNLGTSWTKKSLVSYNDNFLIQGQNLDRKERSDGAYSILIDNDGFVHCFWARQVGFAYPAGQNGSYSLDATRSGIMYWNELMGNQDPILIPGTEFIRESTNGPIFPNTRFFTDNNALSYIGGGNGYNSGVSTWPSTGIDALGNIYLTYAYNRGIIDTTNSGKGIDGDIKTGYNMYDVYTMKTSDKGKTWTTPFNVSSTPKSETTYPSMARHVDDHVHLVYQEDSLYGNAVMTTTGSTNGTGSQAGPLYTTNKAIYAKVPVTSIVNSSTDITNPLLSIHSKFWNYVFKNNLQTGFNPKAVLFNGCLIDTISKQVISRSKKFFMDNILEVRDDVQGSDTNILFGVGLDTINFGSNGTKTLLFYAKDASGNYSLDQPSNYFDTIPVLIEVMTDNIAPTVKVLGEDPYYVYLNGADYIEKGSDRSDNNPCTSFSGSPLPTGGPVDKTKKGNYDLKYEATDGAGNVGSAIRKVYVGVAPTAIISNELISGNKLTAKGTSSLDTLSPSSLNKFVWSYKKGNQSTTIGTNSSTLNYTIPSSVSSFDSICLELSNGFNTAVIPVKASSKECKFLKYTVGISSVSNDLNVSIFPNPTNGDFNIQVEGNRENKARVVVTSMDGKTLSDSKLEITNSVIPFKSNLAKGTYFVSTEVDGKVYLDKIEVR
jgi:hypothetical protein